jgi:hypothetical protein
MPTINTKVSHLTLSLTKITSIKGQNLGKEEENRKSNKLLKAIMFNV